MRVGRDGMMGAETGSTLKVESRSQGILTATRRLKEEMRWMLPWSLQEEQVLLAP